MPIGNMLNGRDQYQAAQDENGTWRILDCWHDAIKALDPDYDVPDDNEAVTILREGAFIALLKEAARNGTLENASFAFEGRTVMEAQIDSLNDQIADLQEKLYVAKQEKNQGKALKETAMEHIVKLAAMDDMNSLSQ